MSRDIFSLAESFLPKDEVFGDLFEPNDKLYTENEMKRHVCYLADIIALNPITDNNMCNYSQLSALTAAWYNRRDIYDLIENDESLWLEVGAYRGFIKDLEMKKYSYTQLSDMMFMSGAGCNTDLIDKIMDNKPELVRIALEGAKTFNNNTSYIKERIKLLYPEKVIATNYSPIIIIQLLIMLFVIYFK